MTGQLGILNVAAGDTKLTFDPNNPMETARAGRVVRDMLKRGYALFVHIGDDESGPKYQRVIDFAEATSEYIIADLDPIKTKAADDAEKENQDGEQKIEKGGGAKIRKAPKARKRVSAATSSGVAVARSSGG